MVLINNEQLRQITDDCLSRGFKVKIRDIAFAVLAKAFSDDSIAYKVVYDVGDVNIYKNASNIKYLLDYLDEKIFNKAEVSRMRSKKEKNDDELTFEENKAEIIKLIKKTQDDEAAGNIDSKQSLELQTKLRVTLNDKFHIQADKQEQMVVVNEKYTDICPFCNHECAPRPMSMQEAMDRYNLVKKP